METDQYSCTSVILSMDVEALEATVYATEMMYKVGTYAYLFFS